MSRGTLSGRRWLPLGCLSSGPHDRLFPRRIACWYSHGDIPRIVELAHNNFDCSLLVMPTHQIQGLRKQTSPLNDRNTKWCAYTSGNHCSYFCQHLPQAPEHLARTLLSILGNFFSLLFSKVQIRSTNRDTGNDNIADSFSAFSSLFNF